MGHLSRRPSPAMVVALVALFFSVTGWGVAAQQALLPRNTVGSGQIVDGSIRAVDLHPSIGQVGTAQILDGSIRLADLHPATQNALRGQRGEPGLPGPPGLQGPPGPMDTSLVSAVNSLSSRLSSVERVADTVCPKYAVLSKVITDVYTGVTGSISVRYVYCPVR